MKLNLFELDRQQFRVDEYFVDGERLTLVNPMIESVRWNQNNKYFRSSMWNSDGDLISAGFPKFTNWNENPTHFPPPSLLKSCTIVEKLDGSLLIVSKYKGQFIYRTRGTAFDRIEHENWYELDAFKKQHEDDLKDIENVSLLFEWYSPANRIVINYGQKPEWKLIGIVNHDDYSLVSQKELDLYAKEKGFKRPLVYAFADISQMIKDVDLWQNSEGVVVYSNQDQVLHKVKSAWYLVRHRMKSELRSIESVIDIWLDMQKPDFEKFFNAIEETFEYEIADCCRGHMSKICDAYKQVVEIENYMRNFVKGLSELPTRKEKAERILQAYGNTSRSGLAFKVLDGKSFENQDYKKLLFQVLKK